MSQTRRLSPLALLPAIVLLPTLLGVVSGGPPRRNRSPLALRAAVGTRLWRVSNDRAPLAEREGYNQETPRFEPVRFVNVAPLVGVDFTYYNDARPGRFFLPEIMGGGVAWLDYDGDGRIDLYFVNGCVLPPDARDRIFLSALFRNDGPDRFTPIAESAGVAHHGYAQGTTAADFDNDGFDDLGVSAWGNNSHYQNNGDGTFTATPDASGLAAGGPRWYLSAAPGDVDRDGDLELYVATYAKVSLESGPECHFGPARIYCGPVHYTADRHFLFDNGGAGRFDDVTEAAGCLKSDGRGMPIALADLDDDGWPEILVGNDMTRNWLFHNRTGSSAERRLAFQEVASNSGVALNGQGEPIATMGIACADYDGDGRLDVFLTNYHRRGYNLFQNFGKLLFVERSNRAGVSAATFDFLGFGTVPLDYDLDGWHDLFMTNGHVLGKNVPPFEMRGQLLHNDGKCVFSDVSGWAGAYFHDVWIGRGAAVGDYLNDGRATVAVVHQGKPAALLRNETKPRGHWLGLRFIGTRSNRSGIGTRVIVRAGGRESVHEVVGGGSYLSESDHRLLVGLGDAVRASAIEIRWSSGQVDRYTDLVVDRYWQVIEGVPPR